MTTSDEKGIHQVIQRLRSLTSTVCTVAAVFAAGISLHPLAAAGLTLGPYSNPNQVLEVTDLLEQNNVQFQQNSEAGRVSLGYIVVTDRFDDPTAGIELVQKIHSAGESDVVFIKSGVYGNRVSAGVFARMGRAEARIEFLQGLGFDFTVMQRSRRATITTIDVISTVGDVLTNRLREITGPGPEVPTTVATTVATTEATGNQETITADASVPRPQAESTERAFTRTRTEDAEEESTTIAAEGEASPTSELDTTDDTNFEGATTVETTDTSTNADRPAAVEIVTEPVSASRSVPARPVVRSPAQPETSSNLIPVLIIAALVIVAIFVYVAFVRRRTSAHQQSTPVLELPHTTDPGAKPDFARVPDLEHYANSLLKGETGIGTPIADLTRGEHAISLLEDVTLLLRSNSGSDPIHKLAFDPDALVRDLIQQHIGGAETKGISLSYTPQQGLTSLLIGDVGKISRILSSLTSHAISQTDSGRVLISASYHNDSDELTFAISHPGGDEDPTTLFDPESLETVVPVHQRLRLAVSEQLATRLGGRLRVSNTAMQETQFALTLTAAPLPAAQWVLPDGSSLQALIAAEQEAVSAAESRIAELSDAQQRAAQELEVRTTLQRELEQEVDSLTSALSAAKLESENVVSNSTHRQAADEENIKALEADLETTRSRLEEQTNARQLAEAAAASTNQSLESELANLKQRADLTQQAHEAAVAQVREEYQSLSAELTSTSERLAAEEQARLSAEAAAKEQTESLEAALQAAEQARIDNGSDSESIILAESLSNELEALKASSAQAQQDHEVTIKQSTVEVQALAAALDLTRTQLEAEAEARVTVESVAHDKVEQLERALSAAQESSAIAARNRLAMEQQAEDTIRELQKDLLSATEAASELDQKQQSGNHAVSRLEQELSETRDRLSDERQAQQQRADDTEEQVRALLGQLQEARQAAQLETDKRESLQHQMSALHEELNAAQLSLAEISETKGNELATISDQLASEQTQLAATIALHNEEQTRLQEALTASRAQAEAEREEKQQVQATAHQQILQTEQTLTAVRQEAAEEIGRLSGIEASLKEQIEASQANIGQEIETRNTIEQQAAEQIQRLEAEINRAREEAEEQARLRHDIEQTANAEVESLRQKLDELENSLQQSEQNQGQMDATQEDIERLTDMLRLAEEKLAQEKSFRGKADAATGIQINTLLDEINQIRTVADREKKSREMLERQSRELLQSIEQELAITQEELEKVVAFRNELQQNQEETNRRLNETQVELERAQHNAENHAEAEAVVKEQLALATQELEELRSTQESLQRDLEQTKQQADELAKAQTDAREYIESSNEDSASTDQSSAPIRSTKAMSHPVMRTRLRRFVSRLASQVALLESAFADQQYIDLVVICNWLKRETQGLGFEVFNDPIYQLELSLRNNTFDNTAVIIETLKDMASRIDFDEGELADVIVFPFSQPPTKAPDHTPIEYQLPTNEKKAELLENFISQLGSNLIEMHEAWLEQNQRVLTKNCHWIMKYAARMNVLEIVYATEDLQEALELDDPQSISEKLLEFIHLYTRIDLVQAANSAAPA
jgi:hypothetical protein